MILDVCSHKINAMNIDNNTPQTGLGSIILENILDNINIRLPNNTVLWLGIDINNKVLPKALSLYTKYGFRNPYITYQDPFKNNYKSSMEFGILALNRTNDYIDYTEINRQEQSNIAVYILEQYTTLRNMRENGLNQFCSINIKFNLPYSRWLKKLPESASTLNKDGTVTQKEVSGAFSLENPLRFKNGDFVWNIVANKQKPIQAHSELSASVVIGRYNFHTHPLEAYQKYQVPIGFPSGADYYVFYENILKYQTIFHCVITLEGVYFISLAKEWSLKLNIASEYPKNIKNFTNIIQDRFELPKQLLQNREIKQTIEAYCQTINSMRLIDSINHPPFFKCNFLLWDEIKQEKYLNIVYPPLYDMCFPTEETLNILSYFNK